MPRVAVAWLVLPVALGGVVLAIGASTGGQGAQAQQVGPAQPAPPPVIDPIRDALARVGCALARPDEYDCTTIAGKGAARQHLAAEGIRDYIAHTWSAPGEYMAGRDQVTVQTESDLEIRVTRGRRGQGSHSGVGRYDVRFEVVRRPLPPPSRCDPSCAALPPTGCRLLTHRKDHVVETLNGPSAGLWAIRAAAHLTTPLTGSLSPTDDDYYRAYDTCERAGAWGGQAQIQLHIRAAAIFQIDDWRTTGSGNNCSATNNAQTPKPTVDVNVRADVRCNAWAAQAL